MSSLITLSSYQYYEVIGEKSLAFLQGQLSCDLNLLTPTQALLGAYLNTKGRVLTTLRLFKHQDKLLLQLPSNLAESVSQRLNRIAALSKVKLVLYSGLHTYGWISEEPSFQGLPVPTDFMRAETQDGLTLIRLTKAAQFMILSEQVLAAAEDEAQQTVWHLGLVQEKLVEIDASLSELFTPHELALTEHQAVSFTKGCYVGQEIVARMQYLGKLKQHLQLKQWPATAARKPLTQVANNTGQVVGQIIDVVTVAEEQYALVLLRDEAADQPLKFLDEPTLND